MPGMMINIPGICKVPEELKEETWPGAFICAPQVGDNVRSLEKTILKVSEITHAFSKEERDGKMVEYPYLVVTLVRN